MDRKEIEALPEFITTAQAAQIIGWSHVHTQKMCREGKIPASMVGGEWRISKTRLLEKLGTAPGA